MFGPGTAPTSKAARSYLSSSAVPAAPAAQAFTSSGLLNVSEFPLLCQWNCRAAVAAPSRLSKSRRVTRPLAGKATDEPDMSMSNCAASGISEVEDFRRRSYQGMLERSPPPIFPPIFPSMRHFFVSSQDALTCHSTGPHPAVPTAIPTVATIIRRFCIGILRLSIRLFEGADQLKLLHRPTIHSDTRRVGQSESLKNPRVGIPAQQSVQFEWVCAARMTPLQTDDDGPLPLTPSHTAAPPPIPRRSAPSAASTAAWPQSG